MIKGLEFDAIPIEIRGEMDEIWSEKLMWSDNLTMQKREHNLLSD
jgi:hypothetical protein